MWKRFWNWMHVDSDGLTHAHADTCTDPYKQDRFANAVNRRNATIHGDFIVIVDGESITVSED